MPYIFSLSDFHVYNGKQSLKLEYSHRHTLVLLQSWNIMTGQIMKIYTLKCVTLQVKSLSLF